jgi:hypothetical protein
MAQCNAWLCDLEMTVFNKLQSLPPKAHQFLLETRNLNLIRASGFFDVAWYLSNNPDVAQANIDPLLHYLRCGGFDGWDPSPRFCSAFYLDTYPDVKSARINHLVHFLMYGKAKGWYTQPSILYIGALYVQ